MIFCLFYLSCQDGRILFLHMFCKGMKYAQLNVHKGAVRFSTLTSCELFAVIEKCAVARLPWILEVMGNKSEKKRRTM